MPRQRERHENANADAQEPTDESPNNPTSHHSRRRITDLDVQLLIPCSHRRSVSSATPKLKGELPSSIQRLIRLDQLGQMYCRV